MPPTTKIWFGPLPQMPSTFEAMPRGWDLKATLHRWNAEKPKGPFTDPIDLGTIRTDGKPIVLRLPAR